MRRWTGRSAGASSRPAPRTAADAAAGVAATVALAAGFLVGAAWLGAAAALLVATLAGIGLVSTVDRTYGDEEPD